MPPTIGAIRDDDDIGADTVARTESSKSSPGRGTSSPAAIGAAGDPHRSVSAGSTPDVATLTADDCAGKCGGLEQPTGFTVNAGRDSKLAQVVDVTATSTAIPGVESLNFNEPETVCGNDDRVQLSPATATPWRWVCELLITYPNGVTGRGTGWFFGPRAVGTAGHVVFSKENGGWAKQIEVIPGLDAASRPFGSQIGTAYRSTKAWVNDSDPEYDYGAIILPNTDLGDAVGFFGFAAPSDQSVQNLFVNLAGYPADKPFGTQWYNAGTVTQTTERSLLYMIDSVGGQSGSAVWSVIGDRRQVVGIHGYGGCPNKAVRVTEEVFGNLTAWRQV